MQQPETPRDSGGQARHGSANTEISVYNEYMMHVTLGAQLASVETLQTEFLEVLQEQLDSARPFTLVVDSTQLSTVPLSVGFEVVKFMRLNQPKFRAGCKASAIIVGSSFIQGLLEWVFTLSPPVSPNVVVQTPEQGFEFVNKYAPPS